ncbi:peptidoglycan-binding protein [Patescibacteria group bacterium]|nr:peptidoglycan-binding protein [Patescibacteria group bacterium]
MLSIPVLAEETNTSSVQELIQALQQQIEQLKTQIQALVTQIESLRQAKLEIKETEKEIKVTLKLIRQLRIGMSGEDIELLQEILATDLDVYPEGLVTGYFGQLTRNAVKRFQKIAGIEQVGVVGPKTLARINELLVEGAGESGKVPPGLLIAQGIRKKLDFEPKPLPGQELPPGIAKKLGEIPAPDTTAPLISELSAIDTTTTSAKITWVTNEEADSKVWYDTVTPLVVTDLTPVESSSELVLEHEIALSDLTPDTTYYYLVSSADEAGNYEISIEETFSTLSEELTEEEQACIDSGGTVSTSLCCEATNDFPNLCLVGPCGCAPENSHQVKICDCGLEKCFDGEECVAIESE